MSLAPFALLAAALASAAPSGAPADGGPRPAGEARNRSAARLQYSWASDGAVVLATGGGWLASELLKGSLAPSSCRWCGVNALDEWADGLRWRNTGTANALGNIGAYAAAPLLAGGALAWAAHRGGGDAEQIAGDLLVVAEAVTVSGAVAQSAKFTAGRARPFTTRALLPSGRDPADDNLSFYSSHTNVAFALAVSAGTVAHIRGYQDEGLVWATGLPLAALIGYSRIAADKHYLTDVLVGAAAGSAFGVIVPWYFHRPGAPGTVSLTPTLGGLSISGTF